MVSPRKPSHFGPGPQVPRRLKQSKIMKMSWKELLKTRLNMPVRGSRLAKYPSNNNGVGRLDAKIVEKSDRKSNRVHCTSKDMKKPTSSSLKSHLVSSDKQKITILSRTMTNPSARLKKSSPLKTKKEDVLEISPPTRLKAMSKLVHKGTKRSKEQQNSNQGDDIIAREDGTKKLELSKNKEVLAISIGPNTPMKSKLLVSKSNFSNEFKEIRDEIVITKEDHARSEGCALCSDCYKQEGTESLEEHQGYSHNSSYAFGTNLSNCQVDQRGLIEVNFVSSNKGQVANSYGKTNNGMPRKRKEPLLAENAKTIEDDDIKYVEGDNMDSRPMKEPRCVRSKDEEEGAKDGGAHIPMGVTNDITRSLSQVAISMDGHAKVSVPSLIEQQHHCCSRPIDKSSWSGIFKIDGKEYISLAGHLSNKSCQKVWSLSTQLAPLVELKSLLRSEVWPKSWEASKPNDDSIGMYFFPRDMRQDKDLDQLIKEVMENDLVLRAIIGDAEMLIFPSILLPNRHQTFQTKHYLWGVFKPREVKGVVVAEPISDIGHCAQEMGKEKQQHVLDQRDGNAQREELDREIISMTSDTDHLLRAKNTQVEASRVKGSPNMGFDLKAPEEGTQAEATLAATDAPASPANHGQIDPSMGLPTSKLMGFVVRQTPKLEQLIQEMKREGALLFAMEGESLGAASWPGDMPIAVQK